MSHKQSKHAVMTARQRRESALKHTAKRSSLRTLGSARQRRRNGQQLNPLWLIGGLLVGVVLIVIFFIYLADHQPIAGAIGPTDPEVLSEVTHVKPSVLAKVNTGGVQNVLQATVSSQALTGKDGKPEIFYYGAEFCPYCGAQRWSVVVALSRFGTFSKLAETISSDQDVDPNTPTFTFVQSQYSSPYLDFVPLEAQDRNHKTLQTPDPHEQQILNQYHVDGFPFVDMADRYVASNPFFDPSLLQGLSQKNIARKLSDPNDSLTRKIVGGANYLTAAMCSLTHDQPATVCTQDPIPAIEQSVVQHSHGLGQIPGDAVVFTRRREGNFAL